VERLTSDPSHGAELGKSCQIVTGTQRALRVVMKLALTVAVACASFACSSSDVATGDEALQVGNTFDAIAQARIFINGERVLPYEENRPGKTYAEWVGDDLHSIHPTYVSGLLRHNGPLAPNEHALSPEEIHAFQVVRSKLGSGVKVDVVLSPVLGGKDAVHDCNASGTNAPCRLTPDQITHLMSDVEDAVHPDVWFFDFFTDGNPATAKAAIDWAHKNAYGGGKSKPKQLIGGHYFGNDPNGTSDADFFAVVDDACGHLGQSSDTKSAQKHIDLIKSKFPNKPILVGVNNNAQNLGPVDCDDGTKDPETFACTWNDWQQSQRKGYVDKRHDQAKARGFDFMYPVFFPACAKGDPNAEALKVYYDADHDGLLGHIGKVMGS